MVHSTALENKQPVVIQYTCGRHSLYSLLLVALHELLGALTILAWQSMGGRCPVPSKSTVSRLPSC